MRQVTARKLTRFTAHLLTKRASTLYAPKLARKPAISSLSSYWLKTARISTRAAPRITIITGSAIPTQSRDSRRNSQARFQGERKTVLEDLQVT